MAINYVSKIISFKLNGKSMKKLVPLVVRGVYREIEVQKCQGIQVKWGKV